MSPEEIEIYKKIIPNCNVIFDVGCRNDNIFYEINPKAKVHLFDPELNEALSSDVNIKYNNIAIGDYKGVTEFHPNYGSILERTDEKRFDGQHYSVQVPIDTIENYCKKNNIKSIDYLKIDTEGYDYNVLKGCGKMLSKIKYIQFEDWDVKTNSQIFELLLGYNLYTINSSPKNFILSKENI